MALVAATETVEALGLQKGALTDLMECVIQVALGSLFYDDTADSNVREISGICSVIEQWSVTAKDLP